MIGPRLQPQAISSGQQKLVAESVRESLDYLLSGPRQADAELRKAMAAKQSQAGAHVTVRLLRDGSRESGRSAAKTHLAVLRALESPGVRFRLQPTGWKHATAGRLSRHRVRPSTGSWHTCEQGQPSGDR